MNLIFQTEIFKIINNKIKTKKIINIVIENKNLRPLIQEICILIIINNLNINLNHKNWFLRIYLPQKYQSKLIQRKKVIKNLIPHRKNKILKEDLQCLIMKTRINIIFQQMIKLFFLRIKNILINKTIKNIVTVFHLLKSNNK